MKKDILKIAGVKSEKEFYKKYPTEEAFMAEHGGKFKKAAMGKSMVNKQLVQLTDYANPPQAQSGIGGIPQQYRFETYNPFDATYDSSTGMFNSPTGQISMQDTRRFGFKDDGTKTFDRFLKDLNQKDIQSGIQATSVLGKNYQKIKGAIEEKKQAKQLNAILPVVVEATGTRDEQVEDEIVRPEDFAFQPNTLSPSYGTGAGFLQMKGGGEIQNTYAPNTLYDNLGYEPLDESSRVKRFKGGGLLPLITEGVNLVGDLTAGIIGIGTNRLNKRNQKMMGQAAFQSGMQGVQNQFSGFMEDGGYVSHNWQPQVITKFGDYDVKQLLAPPKDADMLRSGGHLKEDYVQPSARALQTMAQGGKFTPLWGGDIEPVSYNPYMDGDGITYEAKGNYHSQSDGKGNTGVGMDYAGSKVEVQPKEPIFETGGEIGGSEQAATVLGGIKMPSYVLSEVNDSVSKKFQAKPNQTFQAYGRRLNYLEEKSLKAIDKQMKLLDGVDSYDPFSLLTLNSAKMGLTGADMSLQKIAEQKKKASYTQSAIHDAKDEMSERLGKPLEVNAFSKGIIKTDKEAMKKAQFGIYLYRQQGQQTTPAATTPAARTSNRTSASRKPAAQPTAQNVVASATPTGPSIAQQMQSFSPWGAPTSLNLISEPQTFGTIGEEAPFKVFPISKEEAAKNEGDKNNKIDFTDIYNTLYPYLRPNIKNPLSAEETAGELTALALNTLEGVRAQSYTPQLQTPYRVSLQDQLNEIQADANASKKLVGNNPEALAIIDSNVARAKSKILGDQARLNMEREMGVYAQNIDTLNKAYLTNLQLAADQATKQSVARSNTKAQAIEALKSISQKIAQNRLETLSANVMANMYPQYTYGAQGRIFNTGLTKFNIPTTPGNEVLPILDKEGNIVGYKAREEATPPESKKKTTARNGSVVKALKNL
jgi:hypothetical protein